MTIPLPSSCSGCPFYKYKDVEGNGFVPDKVVKGSRVYFLAQNPGGDEVEGRWLVRKYGYNMEYKEVEPQPLIGTTGQVFNNRFLPLVGLKRDDVSLGNAIRCRPGRGLGLEADKLPSLSASMKLESSKADIVNALKHCKDAHFHPGSSIEVVVTMGQYAMFVMTGLAKDEDEYKKKQSVLESWRGYGVDVADYRGSSSVNSSYYHDLTSGNVVFMTMHIAALFYGNNKRFYHAVLQDFYKVGRLLKGEWPKKLPEWKDSAPQEWPKYSSFDTEYNPDTGELYRWSLCSAEYDLYCVEHTAVDKRIVGDTESVVLIQNALADIGYLSRLIDMKRVKVEDLMLAHSVLWTGEPHGLNYINSLYGCFNRYKHLSQGIPQLYSALDAYEPMAMWREYFIPEFKRDRLSWGVYKKYRLPLIDIIDKAQRSGVKVDGERLIDVVSLLKERLEGYQSRAKQITGDKEFHLGGSKKMKEELYGEG